MPKLNITEEMSLKDPRNSDENKAALTAKQKAGNIATGIGAAAADKPQPETAEGLAHTGLDYGAIFDNAASKPTNPDGSPMGRDQYIEMMNLKAAKRKTEMRMPPPKPSAVVDGVESVDSASNAAPPMLGNSPTEVGQSLNEAGNDMIRQNRKS